MACALSILPRSCWTRASWYQPYGLIGCSLVLRFERRDGLVQPPRRMSDSARP